VCVLILYVIIITSRASTNQVESPGSENFLMGRDKSAIVFETRHTCGSPTKRIKTFLKRPYSAPSPPRSFATDQFKIIFVYLIYIYIYFFISSRTSLEDCFYIRLVKKENFITSPAFSVRWWEDTIWTESIHRILRVRIEL